MTRTKLFRNLKPGEQFQVILDIPGHPYTASTVTVTSVERIAKPRKYGISFWRVYGDFPLWWCCPYLVAYSDERTELVSVAKT